VAVCLVAIVGVIAIAVDGGMLLDNKQSVQAAADAAAMAAATDLFKQYAGGGNGLDSSGKAKASALLTAASNGFTNDGTTSIVTVNIAPTSGNFVGKAGYAEVVIQYNQKRAFSSIFGAGDIAVTARAVACGKPGSIGILILDPALTVAAQIMGKIQILNDGIIYCNSNSSVLNDEFKGYGTVGGVYLESLANLTCGGISVVGSMTKEAGAVLTYTNNGTLTTGVDVMPDPLAAVPEPVPSGTNYGNVSLSGTVTMQPGIYGDITIAKNANVTMAPGIYYISSSGSINMNDGSKLTGTEVMIYNQGGDHLDFQDAASVYLTPPSSGDYQGISIFEPRVETKEVHIKCSNNITIAGTLYAQNGEFDLRPNGVGVVMNCGNYICGQAEWCQGGCTGTIVMNPNTASPMLRPTLVE